MEVSDQDAASTAANQYNLIIGVEARGADLHELGPYGAMTRAEAARFVAARLCEPRDMANSAAAACRTVLLQLAAEAETFAWSSSGGLL